MNGLEEIVATLYALPPEEFVAARDSRAKEARGVGDRALARKIAGLRRPSASAWAVNQLVRHHPHETQSLLELGAQLRAAQEELAGDQLRELNRRRHELLASVVRQARTEAARQGRPLTDPVSRQVETTLRAAMADPDAAAAVGSGLLVTDVQATGFGPVDVRDAVAIPEAAVPVEAAPPHAPGRPVTRGRERKDRGARPTKDPDTGAREAEDAERRREQEDAEARRREREEAHRAVEEAQEAVARSAAALEEAQDRVRALADRRAELAERMRRLTRQLQETREEDEVAARDEKRTRSERDTAARDARGAARDAARARTRWEGLAHGDP